MKKYEMIYDNELCLYRIKALIDIPNINVKVGNVGGYVESESNLSHEDDCWIFDKARVSGNARVYGDVEVFGNAIVYGDVEVYGNAIISGNAEISGNARVYGNAIISGNAIVYGDARVFGNANIYGDARVFRSSHTTIVKYFNLGKHIITVDGDYLNIGCKSYTIDEWLDKGKKIGKENNYTNKEIDIYMNFIKFIKEQRELGLI